MAKRKSDGLPGIDRPPRNPKTCLQCGQTTSDWEADWLPDKKVYLKWVRYAPGQDTGVRSGDTPDGNECYKCYDTRRKKVGLKTSMEQVRIMRKESTAFNESWVLSRRQRVRGEGFYERPAGEEQCPRVLFYFSRQPCESERQSCNASSSYYCLSPNKSFEANPPRV